MKRVINEVFPTVVRVRSSVHLHPHGPERMVIRCKVMDAYHSVRPRRPT